MYQGKDNDLAEIKESINTITKDIAVMNSNLQRQGEIIEKLTESFTKLAIVIERTDENTKKIDTLFLKIDELYTKGTKNCPVNSQKLEALESKVDKMWNYFVGILISVLLQFIATLVYFVEHHSR